MYIGVHLKKQKTLQKTIQNIQKLGGNALQFFSGNPRSGKLTESTIQRHIDEAEVIKQMDVALVIHSAYTINVANTDMWIQKAILNDLLIAHHLGCRGVVIHVGKYTSKTVEEGLNNMKICVMNVIKHMKKHKLKTKLILETAAGQKSELLSDIKDFCEFYNMINEPDYFDLCFDTCHVWSAGFDIVEAYNYIQKETNNAISVVHVNGSKTPFNSKKDRHECLWEGSIPLDKLTKFLKNVSREDSILILETPDEDPKEIAFLFKQF